MNKFEELEKKLNIATTLIEELEISDDYQVTLPVIQSVSSNVIETVEGVTEESTNEIFSLDTLKSDFNIIRQNILKLISTGQRILDSAAMLDPADIKAATLQALSQLQQTLGGNLQLLVSIYKEIANIELARSKTKANNVQSGGTAQSAMVNNGSVTNNNIVFSGDTNQLLNFLKEKENS